MDCLLDLQWLEKGDISFVSFYDYYSLVIFFLCVLVNVSWLCYLCLLFFVCETDHDHE